MDYLLATSLNQALDALADPAAGLRVVAGGTDVYPALRDGALTDPLLDVTRVPGLRGIAETGAGWRIGAATTWTDVVRAPLPPCFDGLKAAAREVGSIQIQNAGTVAGNLCNASPAADGVPPLLALEASVELQSRRGSRLVPLGGFVTGVRQTARAPDELVVAVHVPRRPAATRSAFLKLGSRKYLVISICMVAAEITPDAAGRVARARVAVGACSPVALRLEALEARLAGLPATAAALTEAVTAADLAPLAPIDDIRGGAGYRRDAALELVRRTLAAAAGTGGISEMGHG
ncbi:xanthine dehydrogenase family protein subunit M [Paralimibaculum aggregatum]|uniref:Xanthine dehydrogenase family protein subunit M n=1 Tax=Paralimibaculum aggregatum TaxID=3036245 RepID=A0ABQ6LQW9_9RHOB|nr:FAD binding domain-containing protein [Limibaculum sp. NKW23]GMG84118.1 xanthine dehydrogenase family protein subunit M [Limibaculum sp. NKW23]